MTERPIYGAILAAGYGSRMKPLTDALPKPLLPFLNTPIIAYTTDHLVRAGVRTAGVNLHHLGELIPPVLKQLETTWALQGTPLTLTPVPEDEVRGTAGGVAGIWAALGAPTDGTLVVLNGDPVMNIDLAQEVARHRASGAEATMIVRPVLAGHPGGVEVNGAGDVCRLRDVHLEDGVEREFMGVHILEPSALERVAQAAQRATTTCMVGDVYIPMLRQGVRVRAALVDDFWVALDNPGLLLDATRAVLEQPELFHQAPLGEGLGGRRLWISTPDAVDGQTQLAAPVFLGLYASARRGARIGPGVVADATEFGPEARAKNAVMFGMGRVDGVWEDCVAIQGKIAQVTGRSQAR